jgi:fatty-acyl-CoA synthase
VDPRSLLTDAARRRPCGVAVLCGAARLEYPALERLSEGLARALRGAGAAPGDRVAALFPNCHLYLAAYFAALQAESVLVPLNLRLLPSEQRAILEHSGAVLVIGEPGAVGRLCGEAAASGDGWRIARVEPPGAGAGLPAGGAAHLYYTSGTTGRPKGVVLTAGNLVTHVSMTLAELGFTSRDVWLHAAPMFHLADAWAIWTVTASAGTHVMLPRYDPAAAFDLATAAGVTLTNLVPTMIPGLLHEAERRRGGLPSLRLLLSGGAPIASRTVARIVTTLGCEYVQTYGLTETSPFLTFSLLDDELRALPPEERLRYRARTGRPASGVELRVVAPPAGDSFDDVPRDDRAVGEVVVRGPTVTPGYWADEAATREAFRGGWFHTGDLGTIDARGWLNLVDRAKDVIISGGETIYSTEVEHVLHEHPEVREAAVFAVPDETWGEAVRAAVVLAPGPAPSARDLLVFCRERLAHFKCPKTIDLLEALPRTGSGKIDKKTLREPFWRGRERRIN